MKRNRWVVLALVMMMSLPLCLPGQDARADVGMEAEDVASDFVVLDELGRLLMFVGFGFFPVPVNGLEAGEKPVAIQGKELEDDEVAIFILTNKGRVYELFPEFFLGFPIIVAERVGNFQLPIGDVGKIGMSFTDSPECELHIVSEKGANLMVNLDTGKTSIGGKLEAVASAQKDGKLFFLDPKNNSLSVTNQPLLGNNGLQTLSNLDIDFGASAGMDFDKSGNLLAALTKEGESKANLYRVDTTTGKTTMLAALDKPVESLAILDKLNLAVANFDPKFVKLPLSSTEQQTITATIMKDGKPLADTPVTFEVKGINNLMQQAVTNAEGKASLKYTNTSGAQGDDIIGLKPATNSVSAQFSFGDGAILTTGAVVRWTAGPIISRIKVKGGGSKIILTGQQFSREDRVLLNDVELPAKLVIFQSPNDMLLKLKKRAAEFLKPCTGAAEMNIVSIVNAQNDRDTLAFPACSQ